MPPELLAAIHEAEGFEPAVCAAALLHIARVLTNIDHAEAARQLDRGLALLTELPEQERAEITSQATCLAACVLPTRAFELRATTTDLYRTDKFLFDMVRHGHVSEAVEYLTQWSDDGEFPYDAAMDTMHYARDERSRCDILRSALRAWRRRGDSVPHSLHSLLRLFRLQWRLLPADEARDEIRHMVGVIHARPDERLNGGFGGARGKVTFSSRKASALFELLGPLKQLDPALADTM